ncbi:MAG: DsbE family thiol:disulfide interchange protein [Sphingomonas fennica]
MKRRLILWVPLLAASLFLGVFASGLIHPTSPVITSRLVGRPVPAFDLPPATAGVAGLDTRALAGRPYLLNVFASWCVPCAAEAPQLMALAKAGVPIVAVAIRDKPEDVADFLARYGNPYARIGADPASRVQMTLGSSGVPESFIVGADGVIRRQIVGDIRPEMVAGVAAQVKAAGR